jgi:hypothetical protein
MILRQHEAAQPGSEMARDLGRQRRREGRPVRGEPALTPQPHDLRLQHEILPQEARIALEPRVLWQRLDCDHALLVNPQLGALGTPA